MQAQWLVENGKDPTAAFSSYAEGEMLTEQIRQQKSFTEMKTFGREKRFQEGLLQAWMISHFLEPRQTYACSVEGRVLKVSNVLLHHRDWLIDCAWKWPPREAAEFRTYYELFDQGSFSEHEIFDRFCCLDAETGLIKEKNITRSGLEDAVSDPDRRQAAKVLIGTVVKPFSGWALCWKEDCLPETLEECLNELGLVEDRWRGALSNEGSTRPRQRVGAGLAATLASVLEAYPEGKGAATWLEVEDRVGYSRRNINRALAQSEEHRDWATRGQ